ncbi:MAG TPA: hypothetical protein VLC09_13230 [Polyangiaceae bacterium]|nr:hypothetical protein [Polyangiaceae bacterium]
MKRRSFLTLSGTAALITLVAPAQAAELVLITHPTVTDKPSRADLHAIFTTRRQTWGNGSRIIPFNFPAKHEYRVQFDRTVLGMDAEEVAKYWIDRRVRGGNAPPKQVPNAATIVKLVEKLEGSISYVPRSAVIPGVRVLGPL